MKSKIKVKQLKEFAVDPSAEVDIQVSSKQMPIEDESWSPRNTQELGHALKQLADILPERTAQDFWAWAIKKANDLSNS